MTMPDFPVVGAVGRGAVAFCDSPEKRVLDDVRSWSRHAGEADRLARPVAGRGR